MTNMLRAQGQADRCTILNKEDALLLIDHCYVYIDNISAYIDNAN